MTDLARSAGGGSATAAGRRLRDRDLDPPGLSEAEAERKLAAERRPRRTKTSRSSASIVRANVLTVFNLILAVFGALTLIFGDARDALFLGIIVANSTIGIVQEVRAKRALDRLSLLVAPSARVSRDGHRRERAARVGARPAVRMLPTCSAT
jgi:cation-transporting P-type ATPase E